MMMTTQARIERGQRAERLLDDPLLNEAIGESRNTIVKLWEATDLERSDEREALWATLRGIHQIQNTLRQWVTDGTLAAARPDSK